MSHPPMRAIPQETLNAELIMDFNRFLQSLQYDPLDEAELAEINKHATRQAKEAAFKIIYDRRYDEKIAAFNALKGGGKSQYKSHVTQHMERMFPHLVGKYDILGKYAPYTPRVMANREKPVSPPSNSKEYNRLLWADKLPKMTKADEALILSQPNDKTRDDVFEEIKNRLLSERKKRTKLSKKHKSRRKSALTSRRKSKSRSS